MKPGRRRVERRRGVQVVLGQRDEALLQGLTRLRIARATDLLALFFPRVRRDTAMARLRRLLDGGYVDVTVPSLTEENIYSLGPAGRAWADHHGLTHDPPLRGNLGHTLSVVRVWTRLAVALHGRPDVRLRGFIPDWELRRRLTGSAPPVVADAWVEIHQSSGSNHTAHAFSVEVDLGTERAGDLERKLVAYQLTDGAQDGCGLVVVLVGAGAERRRSVSAMIARHWPGWGLVCAMEEWPGALLQRFGDAHQAPLTDSPDSQASQPAAISTGATESVPSGEGHSQPNELGEQSER